MATTNAARLDLAGALELPTTNDGTVFLARVTSGAGGEYHLGVTDKSGATAEVTLTPTDVLAIIKQGAQMLAQDA
ncbi:hypothetical protein [Plantactinospora sp. WMMB782]|uniref:hypothetical protein n=1 Tax=Plantactinospora sp. WMMB782 TaxID=3404121 RepID=UPI003B966804